MPDDTASMPLFSRGELKQFRYKCSHKLAISLSFGAVYLLGVTVFFVNKAVHNAATQDRLQYYGFAAAGYVVIVGLIAMIVRRSRALNFSRFLNGCVAFDNFGYMLEYAELRMPEPFSPRFLQYPIHLMILGKVLEQSKFPENAEVGRRMIAASAERDPSLEPYREAPLEELMKHHEMFLSEHPEMMQEWNGAESFHSLLVHYILPVAIIVVILSLIFKTCQPPPEETEDAKDVPAATAVRNQAKPAGEAVEATAEDTVEADGAEKTLTPPQA